MNAVVYESYKCTLQFWKIEHKNAETFNRLISHLRVPSVYSIEQPSFYFF